MSIGKVRPQKWGSKYHSFRHEEANDLDNRIATRATDKIGGDTITGEIIVPNDGYLQFDNAQETVFASGSSATFERESRLTQSGAVTLTINGGALTVAAGSTTINGAATMGNVTVGGNPLYNSPITITRSVPFTPSFIAAGSAMLNTGALSFHNTSNSYCIVPLDLPERMKITNIGVYLIGAGHSSLPANMPSFTVYSVSGHTGVWTALGTATDGSSSTVTYDAAHQVLLTLSGQPVVSRTSNRYIVRILSEFGTNSLDGGLQAYAIKYSGIVSTHDAIRFS